MAKIWSSITVDDGFRRKEICQPEVEQGRVRLLLGEITTGSNDNDCERFLFYKKKEDFRICEGSSSSIIIIVIIIVEGYQGDVRCAIVRLERRIRFETCLVLVLVLGSCVCVSWIDAVSFFKWEYWVCRKDFFFLIWILLCVFVCT